MGHQKKLLLLTYYWPPGSGPGVQRWLKFTKFLPYHQWQSNVVTVKNGSYPSFDSSLENDIHPTTKVHKTDTIEPFAIYNLLRGKKGKSVEVGMGNIKEPSSAFAKLSNYIRANYFIPDARVGWNRFAYKEACKIIEEEKPDVIVTTGPPHSTHLIGLKLRQRYHLPWVVDLRDPWTEIFYNQFLNRSKSSTDKDKKLEALVLENAQLIIAATPTIKTLYGQHSEKIEVLLNGYDQSDFPSASEYKSEEFTISFLGNMLPNQNLEAVWHALADLKSQGRLIESFRFKIIGNTAENIKSSISKFNLKEIVKFLPFVPHAQAVIQMLSSHLLYLPIPIDKGNKLILTGKIFEYLATQRPILAVGPTDGDASQLLNLCSKDPMLDFDDIDGIKAQILKYQAAFEQNKKPLSIGNNYYRELSRQATTEKLAKILEKTISQR